MYPERCVLEDHHELAEHRRHHGVEGLGHKNRAEGLTGGQADRQARLALTARQLFDTRTQQLCNHGSVIEGQTDHDRKERQL